MLRRSDIADTSKYKHMTSQNDESTTKLLRISEETATSVRHRGFVVLRRHMDVTLQRICSVAATKLRHDGDVADLSCAHWEWWYRCRSKEITHFIW